MQKPNEMICLYSARGCEAYRVDGRVRVWRSWTTRKRNKDGTVEVEEHEEEMWLEDWQPHTPTLAEVKAEMEKSAAEFSYLSPEHAK